MMSNNILDKRLFTYVLLTLSVLLVGVGGYRAIMASLDQNNNSRVVARTIQVMETSEQLLSLLKDAENGERGYLLTQKKLYLEPYENAKARIGRLQDSLVLLTRENPIQQRRLADLSRLIDRKLDEIAATITLFEHRSSDEALTFFNEGEGRHVMDAIRTGISAFQQEERRLLAEQERRLEESHRTTIYRQIIGSVLSLLLLGLAYWLLRRKLLRESQSNQELEERVQERTRELNASLEALRAGDEEKSALIGELTHTQQALQEEKRKAEEAFAVVLADNERKTAELEEARALQLSLLPVDPPVFPHLEISMHMQTASEVGGDYYDYTVDEGGNFTFAIGDVTGHGLKSGILVATAKSYFQSLGADSEGTHILQQVSEGIRCMAIRGMFMGLTILRLKKKEVTMTSSGMPPVLVYRQASKQVEVFQQDGMFLGFNPRQRFHDIHFTLEKGDVLMAMTDGLVEQFNARRECLGIENICHAFRQVADQSAHEVVEAMKALREKWAGPVPQSDDVSLLILKMTAS